MDVVNYGGTGAAGTIPSGPGGAGGDSAVAVSAPDAEDTAQATGGTGGAGGYGIVMGDPDGGTGGAGGNATAQASTMLASAAQTMATATSRGGQGGSAGGPTYYADYEPFDVGHGAGALGGAAGTAYDTSAVDLNALGAAVAIASATGGTGGLSTSDGQDSLDQTTYAGGVYAGRDGAAASGTTARAVGTSQARAEVTQIGGGGGYGTIGGDGADSSLTDAVSGATTSGLLDLEQSATGGAGGTGEHGSGGLAGSGRSDLAVDDSTSFSVNIGSHAGGGAGGDGTSGKGVAGGDAAATGSGAGSTNVGVNVTADGGAGGGEGSFLDYAGHYVGQPGGRGGAASATGSAISLSATGSVNLIVSAIGGAGGSYGGFGTTLSDGGDGGSVTGLSGAATGGGSSAVSAFAEGGAGGFSYGGRGGEGASASLDDAITATTTGGDVSLIQMTEGGAGGQGGLTPSYADDPGVQGTGGDGGGASSVLNVDETASVVRSRTILVELDAMGGAGGGADLGGVGYKLSGQGGAGVAAADVVTGATLADGRPTSVTLQVSAEGGGGRIGGDATATATGSAGSAFVTTNAGAQLASVQAGSATARSEGTGSLGSVTANANSAFAFSDTSSGSFLYSGPQTRLMTQAFAPVAGDTVALASADFGGTATFTTSYQSISAATGYPAAVADGTDLAAGATNLFAWEAGGSEPAAATGDTTEQSTFGASIDLSTLSLADHVVLDLHHAVLVGSGVTEVDFSVTAGDDTISKTFADPLAAAAYFNNDVIDLGAIDALTASTVSLSITFSLRITADPPGAGLFTEIQAGADAPCFLEGTRILTDRGEQPVELLRVGDRVVTFRNAAVAVLPIRWIGRRRIEVGRHPRPDHVHPVRIARDAVAPGVPSRDVWLSPDHAVHLDGVLIQARQLVNDASIRRDDSRRVVTYFHVELERHAIVLADGLSCESYLESGNRGQFDDGGSVVALDPDQGRRDDPLACAPLVTDGAIVEPIWRRLAERAGPHVSGVPSRTTTGDADLRLVLPTGRVLRPEPVGRDGRHVFRLGAAAPRQVRLRSRRSAPSDIRPWIDDRRQLGVAVAGIEVLTGAGESAMATIPVDDPSLSVGWWAAETDASGRWRWTDGDALLPLPPGVLRLDVVVASTAAYLEPGGAIEDAEIVRSRRSA